MIQNESGHMKTGFGWIKTGGMRYDHDIVIHADGSISKRKKKLSKPQKERYGHTPLREKSWQILSGSTRGWSISVPGNTGIFP